MNISEAEKNTLDMETDLETNLGKENTNLNNSEQLTKLSPYSFEAEQSVLGGLMLDNQGLDLVIDVVRSQDFHQKNHKMIYAAILALSIENKPFDALTLSEYLDNKGELYNVGGLIYLMELIENVPSIANIKAYAQIIYDRSLLRQLIDASKKIADMAYKTNGRNSQEIINEAERAICSISEAQSLHSGPVGVRSILDTTIKKIDLLFQSGNALTGITTGFIDLDKMTSGLQTSDLVIVAGRPSMGKTSFAMNLAENALLHSEKSVIVFSLEMPSDQLMMRMLSSLGRVHQSKTRTGQLEKEDWPKLLSAVERLINKKLFIDDTASISPQEIRLRIRRLVREHGEVGLVVVDYLQLMKIPGFREGRVNEISEISRALKSIAKEFKVPVVALSQLNRLLEQRPNKRPINADLRESGAIEQDADVILFVYRDEVYNPDTEHAGVAEIIIGKQRNGPIGTARLAFLAKYTRFENLSIENYSD